MISENATPLYEFDVPIYYMNRKKKMLLGWNQIINLHPFTKNNLKKWYSSMVASKLVAPEVYDGEYEIRYTLYAEHKRVDPSNIIGVAEKMVLDALQDCCAIENDNWNKHKGSWYGLGEIDKDNPRVLVQVYRVE